MVSKSDKNMVINLFTIFLLSPLETMSVAFFKLHVIYIQYYLFLTPIE